MFGRNDVMSEKVTIRPDIRKSFIGEKMRTSRDFVFLKAIWSYYTLNNNKLKEHLVASFLTSFAYAAKMNLQPNINLEN